jgi:hypothetical protein
MVATWSLVVAASLWAMQSFALGLPVTLALHFALGLGILLPLDRWLDDRRRQTVRLDGH